MISTTAITRDPARLSALCSLWKASERQIWVRLDGRSMVPTIPDGSRIRVDCALRAAAVGEIVAYQRGGRLIVHRVVALVGDAELTGTRIVCQGDGNTFLDVPTDAESIVGFVTEIKRPSIVQRSAGKVRRALRRLADRVAASARHQFTNHQLPK